MTTFEEATVIARELSEKKMLTLWKIAKYTDSLDLSQNHDTVGNANILMELDDLHLELYNLNAQQEAAFARLVDEDAAELKTSD